MKIHSLPEWIQARISIAPNGCWHYGDTYKTGYGRIYADGRVQSAHRYIFTLLAGEIPAGLTLDHICHNRDVWCDGTAVCLHRRCVNPEHLRILTIGENVLASPHTMSGINARRTTCVWGHPLEGDNLKIRTRTDGRKVRVCRECTARRSQERTVRRRNAVKAQVAA